MGSIDAQQFVIGTRASLAKRIDEIRANCTNAPGLALARFRARLEEVGQRLQTPLDADKVLSDPRLSKRIENTAKAGCRLNEREARMDAEPRIRAGRIAQKAIRETQKARRKTDKEVISALESDPNTVDLVHIWKDVRDAMFEQAAVAGAGTTPLDVFLAYVDQNFEHVKAELAKVHGRKGKGKGKKAGKDEAPASGPQPSKHAPAADQTQASTRPAAASGAGGKTRGGKG